MRVVVIGDDLNDQLFQIVRSADSIGAECVFFKTVNEERISGGDLIVIDCRLVSQLPFETRNNIISIATVPNYKSSLRNERIVSMSSIGSIGEIIKKITNDISDIPVIVDPASVALFKTAEKIAPTNAGVLISGETGTGKEVLAQYIHKLSNRSHRKFVAINCAAIPDTLLESELFGHEKGAFTNAFQRRIGIFEEANHGTVLLDEISEMSILLQAKLLRIIQEQEFSRLGSNEKIQTDVRIIATSNKNLEQAISDGTFREDLFYRLNVVPLRISALRDRKKDIVPLAIFFCKKYSNSQKKLSVEFLDYLSDKEWRGNVRELENFVHRAVIFSSKNVITISDIDYFATDRNTDVEQKTLAEIEKEAILNAMEKFGKNKTLIAQKLGISLRTLHYKLATYQREELKSAV